ncbi:hypothetical protein ASD52_27695 [Ensifer sp. Root142]|uniref:hypothetical protein n=1 Tax=Ensifer sp. Root142 TaxID=1736461 RepID=UPI00070BD010|nr:hypothetical protein [Ensifer sp. Root142]KQY73195.1 hypothetical protein ASD52_27695 [Ensifer sp. Root142]
MTTNLFRAATVALMLGTAPVATAMAAPPSTAINTEAELNAKIAEIDADFKLRIDALTTQSEKLGQNLPSSAEVLLDTMMERVEIKLHVPEITMRLQTMKLDVPEVAFKLRKFSWDVPEFRMEMHNFGFMKTKVPRISMVRHEWSTKIPEFAMRLQEWKLHIPEVTMKPRTFSFDVPKVGSARAELKARAAAGDAIADAGERLAQAMQAEIFVATRDYLGNLRNQTVAQFDHALAEIDRAIAAAPNDAIRNDLAAQRAGIVVSRTTTLSAIDAQIAANT